MPELFPGGRRKTSDDQWVSKEELYEQIGRLKAEVEWLKNSLRNRVDQGAVEFMDRFRPDEAKHHSAVGTVGDVAEHLLSPASGRMNREADANASYRRVGYSTSVTGQSQVGAGSKRQTQMRAVSEADQGHLGDCAQMQYHAPGFRTQGLPVSDTESVDRASGTNG